MGKFFLPFSLIVAIYSNSIRLFAMKTEMKDLPIRSSYPLVGLFHLHEYATVVIAINALLILQPGKC